jgi:hypothetical protein
MAMTRMPANNSLQLTRLAAENAWLVFVAELP